MSLLAAVLASSPIERSSSVMSLICLPPSTPCLLISSSARRMPSSALTPNVAVSPVSEATWPTTTSLEPPDFDSDEEELSLLLQANPIRHRRMQDRARDVVRMGFLRVELREK